MAPAETLENMENSKDLLQRLMSSRNHMNQRVCEETETEDIELSLGLSLNGRFGVDPKAKKLTRSSSIPDFISTPTKQSSGFMVLPVVSSSNNNNNGIGSRFCSNNGSTNLVRTCSLPTETDKEWRKRKEMQMLRRMEAKRKRSEKVRNLKAIKDGKDRNFEEDHKRDNNCTVSNINNHQQEQFVKSFSGLFGVGGDGVLPPKPSLQGSIGSQGNGSSGSSESEGQLVQGMNKCGEARSPVSVQSLSECEQKYVAPKLTINGKSGDHQGVAVENNRFTESTVVNGAKEMVRNVLEDMPCVSTKGDGPNGKRIEGFLYRYRKGEEVRIVCVCHGSFLSPAEFVKHAGGGDVAHPLKHIVVNPYPLL